MKQKITKFTLFFISFLLSSFLYSQKSYNVSVDGITENIIALSGDLPSPCVETFSGEMVAGIPSDGCIALTNPNDLAGKIVVLDRGSCLFTEKIIHAQDAGAIAVIICNNRPLTANGGGVIVMGGDDIEGVNLFAVMISLEQCVTFKSNLPLTATFTESRFQDITPEHQVLWGNEPGQGDFDGGLNGWSTATISCDGVSLALDTWKYDPDGVLDEGALSIGNAPGPSFCNGMMAFDSDYLDNGGRILNPDGSINTGTIGTGPCPAPQIGALISPIIDISSSNIAGISLAFYQETKQLNSSYFVQFSTDGGENYSSHIPINNELERNDLNQKNKMTIPLPGAAGASQLRIKFVYSGNYYYWLIDDVKIIARASNNLSMDEQSFAITPNVRIPKSQVNPISFSADIQNIGATIQENTNLSISVTNDASGAEIFSDIFNLGSIAPDSTKTNNLLPNQFTPAAEIAEYTSVYMVASDSVDIDLSDNSKTFKFEVTENEFSKEDGTNLVNFEITDKNQIPAWSIGHSFYLPKGCGYKISGIGIGIGNSDEVGGLDIGIRLFK